MKIKLIASSFLGLIVLNSANANVREQGAYLEGNVGTNYTSYNFWGQSKSEFSSIGLNTNLGYQFSRHFASELGYTYYGNAGMNSVDAAMKGIVLLNNVSLFGKLGAAYIFRSGKKSTAAPYVGLGGSYALTPALDFTVQAQGSPFIVINVGLLSAGLTYHFN